MNLFSNQYKSNNSLDSLLERYEEERVDTPDTIDSLDNQKIVELFDDLSDKKGLLTSAYNSVKNTLSRFYTSIRDRELIKDKKLKERAERLDIKSHELVQLESNRHAVNANYLKAISMLGYVALGAYILFEKDILKPSPKIVVYRAYPWSGQRIFANYKCSFP